MQPYYWEASYQSEVPRKYQISYSITKGSYVDFKLKHKFFDASEIKEPWEITTMPDGLVTFISYLFNVSKTRLLPIEWDIDKISSGDGD